LDKRKITPDPPAGCSTFEGKLTAVMREEGNDMSAHPCDSGPYLATEAPPARQRSSPFDWDHRSLAASHLPLGPDHQP